MNETEFTEWLTYHNQRFTGVANYVAKNESVKAWQSALSDVSLKHAKLASDDMFDGSQAMPDNCGFSMHPKLVRTCAKSHAFVDRQTKQETYRSAFRCKDCSDDGIMLVYHSKYYEPIRQGEFIDHDILETLTIACASCALGTWKHEHDNMPKLHEAMFVCSSQSRDEHAAFVDHVKQLIDRRQTHEWK